MAYIRRRGNQLVLVHGEREPGTGKVRQRILFTLYSRAEAHEVLGRREEGSAEVFRHLIEGQYPDLRFDWAKIRLATEENLQVLPDAHDYQAERLRGQFREDLRAFTRRLVLTDPQDLKPAADLLAEHSHELRFLADLIGWRLRLSSQQESQWNVDNPFYWRFALPRRAVPAETEEQAAGYYERGEYERARAIFRLLVDCFDGYAEGYNYLGLIALEQRQLDEAIAHFQTTVELGRKLFPARIGKTRYWKNHSTRPYMRGLRNLVLALNEAGRFDEALLLCDRLENSCGDVETAAWHRAAVYLNTGKWQQSAEAALRLTGIFPEAGLIAAFALFELGRREQALRVFLRSALNHPRAVRLLLGEQTLTPKSSEEERDHNAGVSLLRALHAYLKSRSRPSTRFFRAILHEPQVGKLLEEMVAVVRRRNEQHPTGEREAFDRMMVMRSREFADAEARKLRIPDGAPRLEDVAIH